MDAMPVFQFHLVPAPKADPKALALTSPEATEAAHRFHRSLAGYAPTPLVSLPAQAARLGIGSLWVKDESHRFGLNAFKGLGGELRHRRVSMSGAGHPRG